MLKTELVHVARAWILLKFVVHNDKHSKENTTSKVDRNVHSQGLHIQGFMHREGYPWKHRFCGAFSVSYVSSL